MSTVLILFAVGIILVAVEVVVPGGVLGALAGCALLGGVITAFVKFGPATGAVATGVALLIGIVTLYLEFVLLPKTRLARALSMSETVAGRSQPEIADRATIVGREAVAMTTLAPTGYVEVDGQRYEASCLSGLVPAGTRLQVIEVETFRLIVTQNPTSS